MSIFTTSTEQPGVPLTPNQQYYVIYNMGTILEKEQILPLNERVYFTFVGAFLKFGSHICRAVAIPELTMDPMVIYKYFSANPDQLHLLMAWQHLLVDSLVHYEQVLALPIWDMPKHKFNQLVLALGKFEYVYTPVLTFDMECQFLEEKTVGKQAQNGNCKNGIIFDATSPQDDPTLLEITLSAFVNGIETKEEVSELLAVQGYDPPALKDFKVDIIMDGLQNGLVNPEISAKVMPSKNMCMDASLYNDGYGGFLNRVAIIAAATMPNSTLRNCPLKRVRTSYRAWGVTKTDFYTTLNLLRFIAVYPTVLNGQLEFSKPMVFEVGRGTPPISCDFELTPILTMRSMYHTGYNEFPVMEVWCLHPDYRPPCLTWPFPKGIKNSLRYLVSLMSGKTYKLTILPTDCITLIVSFLNRTDYCSFSLTNKAHFSFLVVDSDILDPYRFASFSSIEAKYISRFSIPPYYSTVGATRSVLTWRNLVVFNSGKNPLNQPETLHVHRPSDSFTKCSVKRKIGKIECDISKGPIAESHITHDTPEIVRRISKKNVYSFVNSPRPYYAIDSKRDYFDALPGGIDQPILIPLESSVPVGHITRRMIDHNYDCDTYDDKPPGSGQIPYLSPITIDSSNQQVWRYTKRRKYADDEA
jgi:hypothetical protein